MKLEVIFVATLGLLGIGGLFVRQLPPLEKDAPPARAKTKTIEVQEVVQPPPPPKAAEVKTVATVKALTASLAPTALAAFSGFGGGDGGLFGADVASGESARDAGSMVLEKNGVERTAKVLNRTPPEYPREAREKSVTGYVVVQALVAANGIVEKAKVLESTPPGVFDAAALAAIKSWRFEPAISRGGPVVAWVTQKIRFDLN